MGSAIRLDDPESLWVDDGGRSLAYFCKRKPATVDRATIEELKEIASTLGDKNVRLCLHDGPDATFHDMIVFERKGSYPRPHKHLDKGESFHILEGSMAVFGFDEAGSVTDSCVLEPNGNLIYRVGEGTFHATIPLTDFVIYHEAKPGPFLGPGDSMYPSWAPDGNNRAAVEEYTNRLLNALRSP